MIKNSIMLLFSLISFAQINIKGTIKDKVKKEVLNGVSIYAPNTSLGTVSDFDGNFSLTVPENTKQILISYLGYNTLILNLDLIQSKSVNQIFYLSEKNTQLSEVVLVKQKHNKQWEKNYSIFKKLFLGKSKIAQEAEILNPDDLILIEEKDSVKYKLTATANKPLQILNTKTGYLITYELIQFNYISSGFENTYSFYIGYPFFEDITDQYKLNKNKILKARKECYNGSTMHFFRALYSNKLNEEGFSVKHLKRTPNHNYPSIDSLKRMKEIAKKTNDYRFFSNLPQKEVSLYSETTINKSMFTKFENDKQFLAFTDFLEITYTKENTDPSYQPYSEFQISQIKLINDEVEILTNGNFYKPDNVFFYGYMGWEKIGDSLPFDYQN